ncbi:hypothetical protein BT67DRAFT_347183, partial [Trichocladium antarcticum]
LSRRTSTGSRPDYDVPEAYANLGETADVSPVQNPYEEPIRRFRSLEQIRSREQEFVREQKLQRRQSLTAGVQPEEKPEVPKHEVSRLATQLYTISYLILFSILGTLARVGLTALTTYPGTPVIFPSIWPNFAGSLIMGFLSEDRMLFRQEDEDEDEEDDDEESSPSPSPPSQPRADEETPGGPPTPAAAAAAAAHKKTIPLYIGLATGFCGSFTSFSALIRDTFSALANDLPSAAASAPRNAGYSVLAVLAVPITSVAVSLAALFVGAHVAILVAPITPCLTPATRRLLDGLAVVLGCGCWLGAVLLSVLPPAGHADWRGAVTFALVFAPLGCLARFAVSLWLNGKVVGFPVGTFVANVLGTAVLAMAWDLAHAGEGVGGGVPGCQVLLGGVVDGFCGCLTTVSTWVGELAVLRRRHAYVYGGASVVGGLAAFVAVAGGVRWGGVFAGAVC